MLQPLSAAATHCFSQHDILLPASPETEDAVDMMADAILGAAAQGAVQGT